MLTSMRSQPLNHVGIFDAKTHLSDLIDRVRSGESFVVTKHGVPVARLVPVVGASAGSVAEPDAGASRERAAFARLRGLRQGVTLGPDLTVRQLIEEGRKP